MSQRSVNPSQLENLLRSRSAELHDKFEVLERAVTKKGLSIANLGPESTMYMVENAGNIRSALDHLIPASLPLPLEVFELFVLVVGSLFISIPQQAEEASGIERVDQHGHIRNWIRDNHHLLGLSDHEASVIGEACRASGMPSLHYLDKDIFSVAPYGEIRLPLLAALLRLAFVLDLGLQRSSVTPEFRSKIDPVLQRFITDLQIKSSPSWDIRIVVSANVYQVPALLELRNSIQRELDLLRPNLQSAGIFFKTIDLVENRVLSDTQQRKLENPFLQLASFGLHTSDLFAGRDRETKVLYERILGRNVTVLIGESGVGKTSLVEAGVVPRLQAHKYRIMRFSLSGDPLGNLLNQLGTKKRDLVSAIRKCVKRGRSRYKRLLFIGDHLEQIFTMTLDSDAKREFVLEVSRTLAAVPANIASFLFCIREDYLPDLIEFSETGVPELCEPQSIVRLHRLSPDTGQEALTRASQFATRGMATELIHTVLNDLVNEGQGTIYPPWLQIVGHTLYSALRRRGEASESMGEIPRQAYKDLGGVEAIVKHYLDGILDGYSAEDKIGVGKILNAMITEHHTKRRVTTEYLKRTLADCHNIDELLMSLIRHRIVRRSLGEYELIHDVVAARVVSLVKEREFVTAPVRRAISYIEQNSERVGLRLSEVAAYSGVTPEHLAILFRQQLDTTVKTRIDRIRVEKAKKLLTMRRDPLTTVAKSVGFSNQSAFSRRFSQVVGVSPLRYRNVSADETKSVIG